MGTPLNSNHLQIFDQILHENGHDNIVNVLWIQHEMSKKMLPTRPPIIRRRISGVRVSSIAGAFHEAVRGELFGEDPLGRRGVAANVENIRTSHTTQRSLSSPLSTESSSFIEEANFKVGRYSVEERKERISKYRAKLNQRNFTKTIKEFNSRVLEGFQVTPFWHQGFVRDDGRSDYVETVKTVMQRSL
ncbi:hypothetical protein Tsubulata_023581 [Turnera subulata]|uniref:Uncharacterized protein n=1 Tax=Turnera subulata TaxID=218843 RepID=A0A9Q0G2H9_9ROSI|nr:hypothetical protein Tsubulata_023581 [Turnera subulata]